MAASSEAVLHEFQAIGKYRIRILKRSEKGRPFLDIREYIQAEFEGFTRRGVSIMSPEAARQLAAILAEVLEAGALGSE